MPTSPTSQKLNERQARELLRQLRDGATYGYSEYAAGMRITWCFDEERDAIVCREQEAYTNDTHTSTYTDEVFVQRACRWSLADFDGWDLGE